MGEQRKGVGRTLAPLLIGFSLLIILMIMVANFGLTQLGTVKERLDAIVVVHNVKSAQIQKMQHANRERIISLQTMLLTDDFFELDEQAMLNRGLANMFIAARQKLESMQAAPGEAQKLTELRSAASKAAPLNDRVRELLWTEVEGGYELAREILQTEVRPAQDKIYEVFADLTEIYEAENTKAVASSSQAYNRARNLTNIMLAVTVLLSVVTAAYVIARIVNAHVDLQRHRDRLEEVVAERTEELQLRSEEAIGARHDAELANRAKSNFLANMSHELRTPLNAVMGFSETMTLEALGPIPPVYGEYAQHINHSAQHLLSMIEQLLDLSRIEAGHMELSDGEVSIADLTQEVVQIVASASERSLGEFHVQTADSDYLVRADARTLRQVLINVVGNAAKFSDVGDPVNIVYGEENGSVILSVSDHGIGIDQSELERVFKPYDRSSAQAALSRHGTGLGLPIARSLVEAHGGSLDMESDVGIGTRVTIIVPAERLIERVQARKSA